ncbi:MAG: hypothetical protein KDD99_32180, partial [Bacteroidetes bacterium]|nr:hypothetical protein [Bacteroidota bacterium]
MDKQNHPVFNPLDWNETKEIPKTHFQINGSIQSQHSRTMKTLLTKHCPGNGHHPDIISFVSACNSLGIPENECRDFLHQNPGCISFESSYHNNPDQLDKSIRDIYSRYARDSGKFKNPDFSQIQRNGENLTKPDISEDKNLPGIPSEVYENLPEILKEACNILTDQIEKE